MRREAERLQDILDAIAAIERYAGQGRQAFDEQELIQVWVVHHLQIR
ncbi:MAG: nucleotidyltransferase [Coleofasciculus sp. D1-CHI-01]